MEIAIGAIATAILAALGFLLRRWWTGESHLARVDRLEKLASLYSTLREQGITTNDLDQFDALIQKRAQFEQEIEEVRIEADPLRRLRDEALPQQTMNRLAHQASDFADAELERAYQDALACFDGADRDRFVAAHVVWDEYRRQESHFEQEIFHGGSMATMVGALEYEAITRQRLARLRDLRRTYNADPQHT